MIDKTLTAVSTSAYSPKGLYVFFDPLGSEGFYVFRASFKDRPSKCSTFGYSALFKGLTLLLHTKGKTNILSF